MGASARGDRSAVGLHAKVSKNIECSEEQRQEHWGRGEQGQQGEMVEQKEEEA